MAISRSKKVLPQFDIAKITYVPGPNVTNQELSAIALCLYHLANSKDCSKNPATILSQWNNPLINSDQRHSIY